MDSFPVSDTLKWELVGRDIGDSVLYLDSLLDLKLIRHFGTLRLQLDKECSIHRDDTLNLILDTLPTREIVRLEQFREKGIIFPNKNKATSVFCLKGIPSSLGAQEFNELFNIAGKRQHITNKGSNVYIYKLK